MTYQEKRTMTVILTSIVFSTLYFLRVYQVFNDRGADLNPLTFWSGAILLAIPIGIASHVVTLVALSVVHKVTTGEDLPTIEDERDKLIELKSLRVSHYSFMLGFFVAMILALREASLTSVFVAIIISMTVSGLLSEITKFVLYKRGS